MGLFKSSSCQDFRKFVAWLEALIWVLIYGGLLTLILGIWTGPPDDDAGWSLMLGGGLAVLAGFTLIYVRSRIKTDS